MKILITEAKDFSGKAIKTLENAGFSVVTLQCDYDKLRGVIEGYDGVIVRLGIKIDREILRSAKKLKFIATPTTGLDHIDLGEVKTQGIEVISLQGETEFLEKITPTAELAVSLMLNVFRNIVPAAESVKNGHWYRDKWVGRSMQGKTIGIVGMGRLGKLTAQLVNAFGCDVIYYDPFVLSKKGKRVGSLDKLAASADIVSVHVPLNKETEGMIGTEFFDKSKEGQVVINTSRGAVLDEVALCIALKEKKISGAGLDVLTNEIEGSINKSELVQYSKRHHNLVITPHIGGATSEAMRMTEEFIVSKVVRMSQAETWFKVSARERIEVMAGL